MNELKWSLFEHKNYDSENLQTFKNIWEHFLFYSDHEISSYMTMSMFQLV